MSTSPVIGQPPAVRARAVAEQPERGQRPLRRGGLDPRLRVGGRSSRDGELVLAVDVRAGEGLALGQPGSAAAAQRQDAAADPDLPCRVGDGEPRGVRAVPLGLPRVVVGPLARVERRAVELVAERRTPARTRHPRRCRVGLPAGRRGRRSGRRCGCGRSLRLRRGGRRRAVEARSCPVGAVEPRTVAARHDHEAQLRPGSHRHGQSDRSARAPQQTAVEALGAVGEDLEAHRAAVADLVVDPDRRREAGAAGRHREADVGRGVHTEAGGERLTADGETTTVAGGPAAVAPVALDRSPAVRAGGRLQRRQLDHLARGLCGRAERDEEGEREQCCHCSPAGATRRHDQVHRELRRRAVRPTGCSSHPDGRVGARRAGRRLVHPGELRRERWPVTFCHCMLAERKLRRAT